MSKVNRSYEVQILLPSGELITITPPFSMSCQVERHMMATVNTCTMDIKNLGLSNRNKIFKDRYDFTKYIQVIIKAGYLEDLQIASFNINNPNFGKSTSLPQIFQGNVYEAYSYKEGTEWITHFEFHDGLYGIQNGNISASFQAGTDKAQIMKNMIASMPNLLPGVFGELTQGQSGRGQAFVGQSWEVLNEQTQGQVFIDNEKVHILSKNEVIAGQIINLDSSSLKTTPRRRDAFLDCECLFSPELEPGKIVALTSLYPAYNGQYRIEGFNHNFEYSEAECGDSSTRVSLNAGAMAFKAVA